MLWSKDTPLVRTAQAHLITYDLETIQALLFPPEQRDEQALPTPRSDRKTSKPFSIRLESPLLSPEASLSDLSSQDATRNSAEHDTHVILATCELRPQKIYEHVASNTAVVHGKIVAEVSGLGVWKIEIMIMMWMNADQRFVDECKEFVDETKLAVFRQRVQEMQEIRMAAAVVEDVQSQAELVH